MPPESCALFKPQSPRPGCRRSEAYVLDSARLGCNDQLGDPVNDFRDIERLANKLIRAAGH